MNNFTAYIILAEFRVKPDQVESFGAYLDRHAAWSRQEPGCLAFDICQDAQDASLFILHEAYTDESAYLAHRAQPYHPRFFEVVRDMLVYQGESPFLSRRVLWRRVPVHA